MSDSSDNQPNNIITELLEAGVHYGHQTKRWNPKMRDYILEERNSIYIIDLVKTVQQLDAALSFIKEIVSRGGRILFVGTKKQAQEAVKEAALATAQFFVNERWLGGTLTNLTTIRKSVARLRQLEEREKSPAWARMNKQEAAALHREAVKLRRNLDGIVDMERLPDAIVLIDTTREEIAVAEANRLNIPIIAIVDTNSNPDRINYPIAGNDDAIRSIRIILQKIVDTIYQTSQESDKAKDANLAAVAE